ncbi:MAG: YlxR family protein [Eubacterium sp.]|nr:YlxR family protein [Eubacterium sp.]
MIEGKRRPERTCIGCGQKKEKENLTRIVCNRDGEVRVDTRATADGRGAYVCKDAGCLEKAIRSKALNRTFRRTIPDEIYRSLEDEFGKQWE